MQADLEMLRRQLSDLEDKELEVMEQRDARRPDRDTRLGHRRVGDERAGAPATRSATETEIDAEVASETAARRAGSGDRVRFVADYERRRAEQGRGRRAW
jgi:hypothetical protein